MMVWKIQLLSNISILGNHPWFVLEGAIQVCPLQSSSYSGGYCWFSHRGLRNHWRGTCANGYGSLPGAVKKQSLFGLPFHNHGSVENGIGFRKVNN